MPNMDYRQFVDRLQSIERRLRVVELKPADTASAHILGGLRTIPANHTLVLDSLTVEDGGALTIEDGAVLLLLG